MNIVYMIEFKINTFPNKYIGSKSNCEVIDNKIYGKRGLYEGSSRDIIYQSLIKNKKFYILHILGTFDNFHEMLFFEKMIHIKYDVVASYEYFNKSIATISNYNDPLYATYKHNKYNKIARLPRNHPLVLNKTWVGVTSGTILSDADKKKHALFGEKNPFFGKSHSLETINKIKIASSNFHKGKKKTNEHRRKMSESAKKIWQKRRENRKNRSTECV